MINRRRAGAIVWIATVIFLPIQVVVAMRWPKGYSLDKNAISDLGVTTCGAIIDGNAPAREACSPWHLTFNLGLIASGILIIVGAVLLHGWWRGRMGRAGTMLMAIAGTCVVVVGLIPWDLNPKLHDTAATGQALAQWLAMALLAVTSTSRIFRRLTIATGIVSIIGFVTFLAALEGARVPLIGMGGAERLSFDSLTLWTFGAGAAVLADIAQKPRSKRTAGDSYPNILRIPGRL